MRLLALINLQTGFAEPGPAKYCGGVALRSRARAVRRGSFLYKKTELAARFFIGIRTGCKPAAGPAAQLLLMSPSSVLLHLTLAG
jgi:hypothetical protein